MQELPLRVISRVTPTPGVGDQMVNEVRDVVDAAKETAHSVVDQMPVFLTHLAIALAVLEVGILVIKLGRFLISKMVFRRRKDRQGRPQRAETARALASSVFGYLMYFIIVGVILWIFGVDISSIFTAVGVVGIAISFGAQTLVKDIISGLFLWGEGNLTVGDLVTINELSGTVESMTVRTTTLRNFNGNIFVIPNGDIRTITNMSRGFKRAIVNIPCPYEENQERLVAMIREEMEIAAREIPGIDGVPDVMSITSFEHNAVMLQIAIACPIG